MATDLAMTPTLATARAARHRLHYRGLPVAPASLTAAEPPRAGRRMFWRGVEFDGGVLDSPARPVQAGKRFYRGVFF